MVPSAADTVKVRTKAVLCGGAPTMTLKLNGTSVSSTPVSNTSFQDLVFPLSKAVSGSEKVDIVFSNDLKASGCDRSFYIDQVKFASSGSVTPPPPSSSGASLGVFAGQDGGDGGAWESSTMKAVHQFESLTASTTAATKPKMVHMFYPFYISGSCANLPPGPGTAIREGYAPLLTLEFNNWGGGSTPPMTYANILSGTFDACFRKYAQQMKALSSPMYLRMFHEMNGDWYPWAVAGHESEHIQAWRRIHDILASEGATNVKMVWCPNTRDFVDAGPYANYYPGDAYVETLCLDGYNWGSPWHSFDEIYRSSYNEITALPSSDPVVIGEYGSHTGPGDKAQWITDTRNTVKSGAYPRLAVLNYFNQNVDGATWAVNSSQASLDAYKAFVADPYYQSSLP
jgi:hypothetical protein